MEKLPTAFDCPNQLVEARLYNMGFTDQQIDAKSTANLAVDLIMTLKQLSDQIRPDPDAADKQAIENLLKRGGEK